MIHFYLILPIWAIEHKAMTKQEYLINPLFFSSNILNILETVVVEHKLGIK